MSLKKHKKNKFHVTPAVTFFSKMDENLNLDLFGPFGVKKCLKIWPLGHSYLHTVESTSDMQVNKISWSHSQNLDFDLFCPFPV